MSTNRILKAWTALKGIGPYLLIELLLPGGTLLALILWLSQRFARNGFSKRLFSAAKQEHAVVEPTRSSELAAIKPLGVALR